MNSFSKILTITIFLLSISFAANAQRGEKRDHNPEERAEKQTTHMVEKLKLNDEQAAKVKTINLDYAKKMHAVHEENKPARDAMKKVKDEIDASKSEEMKAILTAEQFKAYEEMKKKRRPRKRGPKQD